MDNFLKLFVDERNLVFAYLAVAQVFIWGSLGFNVWTGVKSKHTFVSLMIVYAMMALGVGFLVTTFVTPPPYVVEWKKEGLSVYYEFTSRPPFVEWRINRQISFATPYRIGG